MCVFRSTFPLVPVALFAAALSITPGAARAQAVMNDTARPPVAAPQQVPNVVLTYIPSLDRRRANLARFVAKTRASDPVGAAELEKIIGSVDLIGEIGKQIAPFGLRVDNVADAYTLWWISAWQASRGQSNHANQAQVAAVKAQSALSFGRLPNFGSMNDATRQEMAEAFLVQGVLLDSAMEGAKGDPARMQAVARAATQGALASGMDLSKIDLTDQGFVAARK